MPAQEPKGVIPFLNSALGLWLMSSVFISGLLAAAGLIKEAWIEHGRNIELRKKVTAELAQQFNAFAGWVKKDDAYKDFSAAYWVHLQYLKVQPSPLSLAHFSEFKDSTIWELIWRLEHLPKDSDREAAKSVSQTIDDLWLIIEPTRYVDHVQGAELDQIRARVVSKVDQVKRKLDECVAAD